MLAVVAAGLYLGHTAPTAGYETRLVEEPLWRSLDLLLEAITFALIGLQLKFVVETVIASDQGSARAAAVALATLAVTILVRPLYVFGTAWLDRVRIPGGPRQRAEALGWRESLVVSAAGMRGVVTLAAAAAIPVTLGGVPFIDRATIQLAAFTVAIGTLLVQGSTLPWLIRRLGVGGSDEEAVSDAAEEARVRELSAQAQARVIDKAAHEWAPEIGEEKAKALSETISAAIIARGQAASRLLAPDQAGDGDPTDPLDSTLLAGLPPSRTNPTGGRSESVTRPADTPAQLRRLTALRTELNRAQRQVLVDERDAGNLNETVMRRMLRELDLEAEGLAESWVNRI